MPLTGKSKIKKLNSCLTREPPEQNLSISYYSQPKAFVESLTQKRDPFPSNDPKKNNPKRLEELLERKRVLDNLKARKEKKKSKKIK